MFNEVLDTRDWLACHTPMMCVDSEGLTFKPLPYQKLNASGLTELQRLFIEQSKNWTPEHPNGSAFQFLDNRGNVYAAKWCGDITEFYMLSPALFGGCRLCCTGEGRYFYALLAYRTAHGLIMTDVDGVDYNLLYPTERDILMVKKDQRVNEPVVEEFKFNAGKYAELLNMDSETIKSNLKDYL